MDIEKLTYNQLTDAISKHNDDNKVTTQFGDDKPLSCVIVFKNESWPGNEYSLESRSYRFRSDNKHFVKGMLGRSIFADSIDGSDRGVRLDCYLGDWIVDYCYIERQSA